MMARSRYPTWLALPALALAIGCTATQAPRSAPPPQAFDPSLLARANGLPKRPDDLPKPDSIRFTPPETYTTVLSNGIKLYVLENHELPLVNVDVLVGNGFRCDPPDRPGVASFTASVMRRGGSVRVPGDVLDDTLDFLATSISVGMEGEAAAANLNVLRKDFATGLSFFADVLMDPGFPQAKLDETKRLTRESIRRRDDDPYEIARRKFRQVVYGATSPFARQLEFADVDRITRDDLVAFHRTWFRPNITYMAVSGDIGTDEAVAMVRDAFAAWQPGPVPDVVLPPTDDGMRPGVYIYPKDVTQAAIRMGWVGMPRHSPDEYAVDVLNQIYGQDTFTSRLGTEVRSNRGLAYYVFGVVLSDPDPRQGMFVAAAGTRVDKTYETIGVMRQVTAGMSRQPISDEEMATAKDAIVNSFVFQYDSPAKIVGQQMRLAFEGYPPDYLKTYIGHIRAVTKLQVLSAARKYLDADSLRTFVVGAPAMFDRPLDAYGPVTVLRPDTTGQAASP